ncbi:PREDICTED: protein app1-like [Nelumbo nucifera]|uniref:Protein app1-like n=1 Tax=Nelumbo nucifera TaxID=4432 RepID=A0A1U8A221_NELNU|nr:PREDICTED: protein app1-like [Nelumbo nucifera]
MDFMRQAEAALLPHINSLCILDERSPCMVPVVASTRVHGKQVSALQLFHGEALVNANMKEAEKFPTPLAKEAAPQANNYSSSRPSSRLHLSSNRVPMANHQYPQLLLPLLLITLSLRSNEVAFAARQLLEETPSPAVPELPKPELPPLPTIPTIPKPEFPPLPKPELPTLPKPELPPVPEVPSLPKPELPPLPKAELPPLPHFPTLPKLPELPKDIPIPSLSPPYSTSNP